MSFGWHHEFLEQAQVGDLAAAESALTRMLNDGAMIVHVYQEFNSDSPEMVGRHYRLAAFMQIQERDNPRHEVERFLLDPAAAMEWQQAVMDHRLLDERWSIVDFWPESEAHGTATPYGRATLEHCSPLR